MCRVTPKINHVFDLEIDIINRDVPDTLANYATTNGLNTLP